MRIIMAHKEYSIRSGASRHVFELTSLLESAGHEVIPFSMRDPRNQPSPYEKYFVSAADFSTPRWSGPLFFKNFSRMIWSREAADKMNRLIRDVRPDLVHVHNIYHHISPSIFPVIRKSGRPIVQTLHDYKLMCPNYLMRAGGQVCEKCRYRRYWQPFFQKCVKDSRIASAMAGGETAWHKLSGVYEKNIEVFIAPSRFLCHKLQEWKIKTKRVEYLPNFMATSGTAPTPPGEYFLYGLARLAPEKGLWTLLRVAKDLPAVLFKIWGEGPLRPGLEEFTRRERLKNIEFLGDPKTPEAKNIIRRAYAVVVPSECYENNSYAALEAMAYGKPLVASDIGGNPEQVGRNERGLLFKMGDVAALRRSILELWNDKNLALRLGAAGQQYVSQNLNASGYRQRIQNIYKSVL